MGNPRSGILKLLESKRQLFEEIEKNRQEQLELLKDSSYERFYAGTAAVDHIIEKIKNIDYDIARLESDEFSLAGLVDSGDIEVKKLVYSIIKLAKKNNDLTGELINSLRKSHTELKAELDSTVEMSQIGGYKPSDRPSPAYFDKTS